MTFSTTYLMEQLSAGPVVDGGRYVVAYSGGLDSHVLLYAMAQIRQRFNAEIMAVHVDHGVSDNARSWAQHCRQVCQQLDIPLKVASVQIDSSRPSMENELRSARYQVFEQQLTERDVLLLAHHADDQVETVLQRLLRGSGARGSSGMPGRRPIGRGSLLRPLLEVSRAELQEYAITAGLQWIEDESNSNEVFDRNFIRHQLMPGLEQRWPGCRKTLIRHARINREIDQSLDFFLQREIEQLQWNEQLDISQLQSYERSVQLNLVRHWIASKHLSAPGYGHLGQILDELVEAKQDAQPLVRWADVCVRRYKSKLYAAKALASHDTHQTLAWRVGDALESDAFGRLCAVPSAGAGLNKNIATEMLTVRFRTGSERCRPQGRQGSHPLKKLFQEYGVPPWLRERVPLIYKGEHLVAVADLWVCHGYGAANHEEAYKLVWDRP